MKLEYICDDTRVQYMRFYELLDLLNKVDGRRELKFEDNGYVENPDLFLLGCLSGLPVNFYIDGSTVNWTLINCTKKFKTMLDFYKGLIPCNNIYFSEIEGFMRDRFKNKNIVTNIISQKSTDYERLIAFLKI